jgi:hypothetical protein
MLTIASFWVCWDCREVIITCRELETPTPYPVMEKLYIADVEDEGVPTACECDICNREDKYSKAYRVEYREVI